MRLREGAVKWTILLTVLSALIMLGILALFYGTDDKALAMRLMRAVNPMSSTLPRLTQNVRPTTFTIRLYDFLVVFVMALQGFLIGAAIDSIRWVRRSARHRKCKD